MKYNPQFVADICQWIRENGLIEYGGATFRSLCETFHIDDQTWYRWMRKAEFADEVTKAKLDFKESLEKKLVNSLAKAAEGYDAESVRTEYGYLDDGTELKTKRIVETKPVAPSVAANIFLLVNLAPDRWKNKQSQELTGADGESLINTPIQITIAEAQKKPENGDQANNP